MVVLVYFDWYCDDEYITTTLWLEIPQNYWVDRVAIKPSFRNCFKGGQNEYFWKRGGAKPCVMCISICTLGGSRGMLPQKIFRFWTVWDCFWCILRDFVLNDCRLAISKWEGGGGIHPTLNEPLDARMLWIPTQATANPGCRSATSKHMLVVLQADKCCGEKLWVQSYITYTICAAVTAAHSLLFHLLQLQEVHLLHSFLTSIMSLKSCGLIAPSVLSLSHGGVSLPAITHAIIGQQCKESILGLQGNRLSWQ